MSTEITFSRRTLRIRGVVEKTGLAESSVWRLAQLRRFPLPVKLSPISLARDMSCSNKLFNKIS